VLAGNQPSTSLLEGLTNLQRYEPDIRSAGDCGLGEPGNTGNPV